MKVCYLYGAINFPYKEKEKNVLLLTSDTELICAPLSLQANTLLWGGRGKDKKDHALMHKEQQNLNSFMRS